MIYAALRDAIIAERPVALVTGTTGGKLLVYADGTTLGALPGVDADTVIAAALALLARGENTLRDVAGTQIFIETYPAPPTLLIVGAVHIAIPLVSFAKILGYRTIVIDARGVFATPERFAHADELIVDWPDDVLPGRITANSAVVLLTHDPKLDDPALKVALASEARYVGALGSPKTHAQRVARLRAEGVPDAQLARLHAPIGLKIGGATPEAIALSIIAEIVAVRNGRLAAGERV